MINTENLDDPFRVIAALLRDIFEIHGAVYNCVAYENDRKVILKGDLFIGVPFLTEVLPALGKAFDKALTNTHLLPLSSRNHIVYSRREVKDTTSDGEIPEWGSFLEPFFERVLNKDGSPNELPCPISVGVIRQVCYLFYKYELPYTVVQEQQVVEKFERTEQQLIDVDLKLASLAAAADAEQSPEPSQPLGWLNSVLVVRRARYYLQKLFRDFDPLDIYPRHGPGAVATRQKLWEKYQWTNVCQRITDVYPFDEYFCSSLGHVCDEYRSFSTIGTEDLPARVVLVPKDSRGPRLISCEPVDFQWVQQGLGAAIVKLVEGHRLTKDNVHFTSQESNQFGSLLGSKNGHYVTLDLNEASDRVSLELVRLLFPRALCSYMEACRSTATELPDARMLKLRKYAPMGSCLCFPILALTIWAILTAAAPDRYTRERILVYGDDVIVPKRFSEDAIEQLESFGLLINRDKSCTSGLFRESCGMDAFQGVNVTPVRLRTVWSTSRSPNSYASWIAYANSFYAKRYYNLYDLIVQNLHSLYGAIPSKSMNLSCPSLVDVLPEHEPKLSRFNRSLQKREWKVWDIKARRVEREIGGWSMLLRFFTEMVGRPLVSLHSREDAWSSDLAAPRGVRSYTQRRASKLVRRWR